MPVGRLGGSGVVSLPEILILFHDMIFLGFLTVTVMEVLDLVEG